ncbi:hypothetical protein ENUP19_0252G0041 [Entamoeba nuttalli]|uniref:Cupin domain containing protein n=2 Tax=Entamoeba nuttalli TaxID=412467 RepID=K2GHZ4_ENTNP|nr:cupin domain containing protein [Entamoeba nuttalli P19]EKE42381.1 cupin domain containing protein [Entamoeba nuttalli P19]|eukprot:XP_008855286.1 cupin domain containing protein [Entamoeba nuttalli P19]
MQSSSVKVEKLIESTTSWDGTSLPSYPDGQPKISVMKIIIPPHTHLEKHHHLVINAGVIIKGELTVILENGKEQVFSEGEAIIEVVGKIHYGENRTDENVILLMFYAGNETLPLTEQQ